MNTSLLGAFAAAVAGAILVMFVSSAVLKPRPSSDAVGYVLPAPAPAAEAPKAEAAKAPAPKAEAPKAEAPKATEAPKVAEAPKADAAKAATPPAKAEAPAAKDAAAPAPAPAPAAGGFDAKAVAALVGKAKPEDGAAVFKKCAACHVAKKDAASAAGPNLWGVVGRAKASQADFASKYSEALKGKGGNWGYEELAAFIYKPKEYVPNTKMLFAGIPAPAEIASLIAYLRAQADSPAPLPN